MVNLLGRQVQVSAFTNPVQEQRPNPMDGYQIHLVNFYMDPVNKSGEHFQLVKDLPSLLGSVMLMNETWVNGELMATKVHLIS